MEKYIIGLLTADLNSGNMGCNALTYGAITLLEDVAQKLGCSFQYILFSNNDCQCIEHYKSLTNVDISFCKPVVRFRNVVKEFIKRDVKKIVDFNSALKKCDVFCEIAGGDSYSDIYGMNRPVVFDKLHTMIIKKEKPLFFLPQTVGPFSRGKAQKMAKKGLSYATHIFARDPISFEKAKKISSNISISQTIDMAFFMDYVPRKKTEDKQQIGINPSGLLWNGGYTGNNQFGLTIDYQQLIRTMIEQLDPAKYQVVLVPHVLNGPGYLVEDDNKVCKWLNTEYPHCEVAPFFYTPMEAKSYISGLDLLAGSRMHCCIASYSTGVPVYPLAYSRKFRGLFQEELEYPFGAELDSMTTDEVVTGFMDLLSKVKTVQEEMSGRLEALAPYKEDLVITLSKKFAQVLQKNI